MALQEGEEVENPVPLWLAESQKLPWGEEGLDIWLEGREGLKRLQVLVSPILISPSSVCVKERPSLCVHLFCPFWGLCFSILSPPWVKAELCDRTMSWESEFGPTWAAPGLASSWVGGGIHTDQGERTLKKKHSHLCITLKSSY